MNGKRQSGSSTQTNSVSKPKLGTKLPIQGRAKLIRLTETGLVLVFFMCVKALMVYFATYSAIQRVTACLMLSLPIRSVKKK